MISSYESQTNKFMEQHKVSHIFTLADVISFTGIDWKIITFSTGKVIAHLIGKVDNKVHSLLMEHPIKVNTDNITIISVTSAFIYS